MMTYNFLKLKKKISVELSSICVIHGTDQTGSKHYLPLFIHLPYRLLSEIRSHEGNWKGCHFCSLCFKVPMFPKHFVPTLISVSSMFQDPVFPGSCVSWTLQKTHVPIVLCFLLQYSVHTHQPSYCVLIKTPTLTLGTHELGDIGPVACRNHLFQVS